MQMTQGKMRNGAVAYYSKKKITEKNGITKAMKQNAYYNVI